MHVFILKSNQCLKEETSRNYNCDKVDIILSKSLETAETILGFNKNLFLF